MGPAIASISPVEIEKAPYIPSSCYSKGFAKKKKTVVKQPKVT